MGLADKIAKLKDEDVKQINSYLKILEFDYTFTKPDSKKKEAPTEKVPKNLLAYAEKIAKMGETSIDKINGYLKALDSIHRISLTDGEQMKRAGDSVKKGFNKLKELIK